MNDHHSIYWSTGEARLKGYSASLSSKRGRARDVTVVKVEIEVADPYRLGMLLEQLSEIRADQEPPAKEKTHRHEPLLLTYGSER